SNLLAGKNSWRVITVFIACLVILIGAVVIASLVQQDFGNIEVSNVEFENYNGIPIRAKLFRPVDASPQNPFPGVVYIHGYQNNRETGDAYCIEMARRGFVVLNIDAIGRGNSGIPNDPEEASFDVTYGGKTAFSYLKSFPFVDPDSAGMMGHSLGAEMAYAIALQDPSVRGLVISGFAYREDATPDSPKNMLMIFGKWDDFRDRMTATRDFEAEWMGTKQTKNAISADNPQFGETYGDFAEGTARRVFMPRAIHIQESHSRESIAEALEWMQAALQPPSHLWIDPQKQTWQIKEWATLVAMLAGLASLLPLGLMLLRTKAFQAIQGPASTDYASSRKNYWKYVLINGLLMLLYLPLILVIFAIHIYVVPIDKAFPMMMVNGMLWWFLVINIIGFFIFRGWFKKQSRKNGVSLSSLGISFKEGAFTLLGRKIGLSILLAAILFVFAYFSETILERFFIVDYRFIFPFASDLTPYRTLMFLIYFPFLLVGFLQTGIFLHGQTRRPQKDTWLKTFLSWSISNCLAMTVPLVIMLLAQYIPLITAGVIPFVGPSGALIPFVINLFHIVGVLLMVTPLSTWFYQLTGKIYVGAFLNAAIVAWMFTSSQVIAPLPI
ncbi:MAG: alpha/beta hydrolase, partial [Anaerolineaceae bacterium]|nr:alpha/beta hydrolase [Anaerolineaceae bacterium]